MNKWNIRREKLILAGRRQEYMIRINNICKTYKGKGFEVQALKNITLEIEKGEMVAVVGTSGSGKTTLLNILGLIDEPESGEYILNSYNINRCSEKELAKIRNQNIGFILQDFALINRYTVEQNIQIPLMYSDIPKSDWNRRIDESLYKMGIYDKKKRIPAELSGGQKQRVAIARALVTDADVILADEPTGALDSKTSLDIMKIFQELQSEKKTIIIVTHDNDIAQFCGRIFRIEDGKLV